MMKSSTNIKSSLLQYENIIKTFKTSLDKIYNPKKFNNSNYNFNIFSINNDNTLQSNKFIKNKNILANKISFFVDYNLSKFPGTFGEF